VRRFADEAWLLPAALSALKINLLSFPGFAGGMAISRRLFLAIVGCLPLMAIRPARAYKSYSVAPAAGDEVVVYRGWILRRDDLPRLPPA
jgi:hypothetical protein